MIEPLCTQRFTSALMLPSGLRTTITGVSPTCVVM
jgi:hypothetical protein